jgi:hypothetical protein
MPEPVEGKKNEWFVSEEEQKLREQESGLFKVLYTGRHPIRTPVGLFLPDEEKEMTAKDAYTIKSINSPEFQITGDVDAAIEEELAREAEAKAKVKEAEDKALAAKAEADKAKAEARAEARKARAEKTEEKPAEEKSAKKPKKTAPVVEEEK